MLTVHHLGISQSERIVWLCEELGLDYELKLYARRGVDEYWLVDWQRRRVELYRRDGPAFRLGASLTDADQLQSPLLPGFAHAVDRFFFPEEF